MCSTVTAAINGCDQDRYRKLHYDSLFLVHEQHLSAEKRRIGQAAADLIQPNETVGITGEQRPHTSAERSAIVITFK
jgi:DeoR/GlpR family transcriptional regulator of sugar metabolism